MHHNHWTPVSVTILNRCSDVVDISQYVSVPLGITASFDGNHQNMNPTN
jgi:hypothetical protein